MKKDLLLYGFFFVSAAVVQLYIAPIISIDLISPDFILIIVVSFSLKNGQIPGTFYGFVCGFIFDIISGGIIGSAMFSKTLAGFIAGYFFDENEIADSIAFRKTIGIVMLCAVIDSFFYSALGTIEVIGLTKLLTEMSLLSGFYTALLSIPFIIFKSLRVFN